MEIIFTLRVAYLIEAYSFKTGFKNSLKRKWIKQYKIYMSTCLDRYKIIILFDRVDRRVFATKISSRLIDVLAEKVKKSP